MRKLKSYESLGAGAIGLAGVVLFAAKSVFAKIAFEYHADPIAVLYLRMLIALPLLLTVGFFYEKYNKTIPFSWKNVGKVALISVVGYYISSVFDFVGLLYVEATIERLLLFLYPTMVIIMSVIYLKKPVTPKQIVAISISYLGLLVAFGNKLLIHPTPGFWLGVLLIFLSSLTYAIFLTASDKLIKQTGSVRFTTVACISMCICVIIHAIIAGKTQITGFAPGYYSSISIMAIFSTVLPVYMFNYAIGKLGASNVSIISCFGPICTILLSAALLSETITIWQVAGTFIVMGGIAIINVEKFELSSIYLRFAILKRVTVPIEWFSRRIKR